MKMAGNIAGQELTTLERCEWLLTAIACSMTGKPAVELLPWKRRELAQFAEAFRG
jgi:hypothetical protein